MLDNCFKSTNLWLKQVFNYHLYGSLTTGCVARSQSMKDQHLDNYCTKVRKSEGTIYCGISHLISLLLRNRPAIFFYHSRVINLCKVDTSISHKFNVKTFKECDNKVLFVKLGTRHCNPTRAPQWNHRLIRPDNMY